MSIEMSKASATVTKERVAQPVPWTKRLASGRVYLGALIVLVWGLVPSTGWS